MMIQINRNFEHKFVKMFLSVSFSTYNMRFPAMWYVRPLTSKGSDHTEAVQANLSLFMSCRGSYIFSTTCFCSNAFIQYSNVFYLGISASQVLSLLRTTNMVGKLNFLTYMYNDLLSPYSSYTQHTLTC